MGQKRPCGAEKPLPRRKNLGARKILGYAGLADFPCAGLAPNV
jgi:hypothetical protein